MIEQAELDRVLLERFGFSEFRPGQRRSVEELLLGSGSLLCIQPTGYGKSLLYQLPAALLDGITLVVSPLLALMRDQLQHLNDRFGLAAASINSDQSEEENDAARAAAAQGRVRLLFVSPEHLDHVDRFEALAALPIRLLVVDEAHCISTWGHDFRPAYRQIVHLLRALQERHPSLRVLGLTATADERVEEDIRGQLQRPGATPLVVHRSSMDRPNLSLAVVGLQGMASKLAYLAQIVPRLPSPGIVYCATRERTELVAGYLQARGLEASAYHAGLEPERKRELQASFLHGDCPVIAATNALGMGIDKSDLRYVIHVDVPGSVTAYYQEVGRAGRDGRPARGILLYDPEDRRIQEHFIDSAQPQPEDFAAIVEAIEHEPLGLTAIKVRTGLHPTRVTVVVAELVEQGFVRKQSAGGKQVYGLTQKTGTPDLGRYRTQQAVRTRDLEEMQAYGRGEADCLMATLRRALGDREAAACGRCSLCRGQQSSVDIEAATAEAQRWLESRPSPIAASARPEVAEGLALLDGEIAGPLFRKFFQGRETAESLPPALAELLRTQVRALGERFAFAAVAAVPSRDWRQREEALQIAAETLGVPALPELVVWREEPRARQSELRNNDQRRENVENTMKLGSGSVRGEVLLLDDFVGSGATIKEAARVLRKDAKLKSAIVPLTLARVRWKLGSAGRIH
ncbi:RecQ family ATP-dependent DNA helicase [Nannocystis sp. ILAH1]|uniref:RecQ family ATP-dependent DNA helicase n=1 Tax=Nannocystis sp. ILAH1 TaxID=2996789 RepID=UPI0022721771|nr:RecQ family ATP-dependent DNA helicase [Nannocystis sp. ILAH1]MCY0989136.1 RecQ family ATP-dependent DNA helicase [Nannocystis sp. ILAH1]